MKYTNLATMFFAKREEMGSHTGYMFKSNERWHHVSFNDAVDRAENLSAGLASLGIKKNDKVAILSANRLEWALIDYAAMFLGAILVPLYPSLLEHQIQYIVNDSEAKVVIVEDQFQLSKVENIRGYLSTVENFFLIDTDEGVTKEPWHSLGDLTEKGVDFLSENPRYIADSVNTIKSEDIATIVYTSGTTGEPKGVVLCHKNFLTNIEDANQLFDCYPEDVFLSFLPLSHIFERTVGHFFSCYHGATVAYAESIDTVAINLVEVKPTLMAAVPRFFEKIYSRVLEAVESGPATKRKIFHWAINMGKAYMHLIMTKQTIPAKLKLKQKLAYQLVFSKLKERVGGRLRYFVSGGAPLSATIGEFFNAAGLIILEGYGLTETSPGICFNRPDAYKFGTVGPPLPSVEIRIADDGEILTRGNHVMIAYYKKEEDTKDVIDHDGWFYTGDIGFIDDDGYLVITDRKKNIIVTSGGKNIAPQPIENSLTTSQYIEQAVVIGDKRNYCTALLVPNPNSATHWAQKQNLAYDQLSDVYKNTDFIKVIRTEVDRLTSNFASFETIKKFALIPNQFTQENGEITPSLKIKRRVIEKNYAEQINELYNNSITGEASFSSNPSGSYS